jgi:arsenate reductase
MSGNVLFICEHGSAKSVIAAAHYERLARERGIDAHAASRGTDTDAEFPPHVLAGLRSDGLEPLDDAPVAFSEDDVTQGTKIITFCSPAMLPEGTTPSEVWDDVPPVSEGYERARDEIVRRVERLIRTSED